MNNYLQQSQSLLGPFLFQLYLADLPDHCQSKTTVFADDTSLRCVNKNPRIATRHIQSHLNTLSEYYNKWKIRVNATKSESIIVTRRRRYTNDSPLPLSMNGCTIPNKTHVKYLGVELQSNNKFNHHCQTVLSRANARLKKLWRFIGPKSSLHVKNKVLLYKTYLRPIITYNIQVWGDEVSQTTFKKLQIFQNKCLRLALNLRPNPVNHRQVPNTIIHVMANVPPLEIFKQKLKENFFTKAAQHSNPLISQLSHQ